VQVEVTRRTGAARRRRAAAEASRDLRGDGLAGGVRRVVDGQHDRGCGRRLPRSRRYLPSTATTSRSSGCG
jgi:hypothetical protein